MCTTKPTPHASCSWRGSYRPCPAGVKSPLRDMVATFCRSLHHEGNTMICGYAFAARMHTRIAQGGKGIGARGLGCPRKQAADSSLRQHFPLAPCPLAPFVCPFTGNSEHFRGIAAYDEVWTRSGPASPG